VKWAIFIPRILSEAEGGTRVYVDRFAAALLRRGHEVHVFTTSLDESLPEHDEENGVQVHRVFVRSGMAGPLRFGVRTKITRLFNEVDSKESFDVINLHSAYLLHYGLLRRRPLIMQTVHAVVTYEYLFKLKKIISSGGISADGLRELLAFPLKLPLSYFRERTAIRRADAVIVMSRYVRGTIRRFFPRARGEDVFVSRIGIDTRHYVPRHGRDEIRKELGLGADEVVFLTVRRLAPRMGLENLIEAFAMSAARNSGVNMKLLIAGRGELQSRLTQLIEKRGLSSTVRLMGFVPAQALLDQYAAADAFVLPTEELEGFGIVSLEALASNLPVIATPAGANPEVVGPICPELMT
jgi:glycosyltransferase involved in cell wall biosynthesis